MNASTPRDIIPFFSDLPVAAIKAAARLFDAAQSPNYNGLYACNDFTDDLGMAGIPAPPRAVIKRWVAGVQAGLIQRPGGDAVPADVYVDGTTQDGDVGVKIAYFDTLPPSTTSALQAAWDRAQAGGFDNRFMYKTFGQDLTLLGFEPPVLADFNLWVKGVMKGEIERPARQIAGQDDAVRIVKIKGQKVARATQPVPNDTPEFEPLTPETFPEAMALLGKVPLLSDGQMPLSKIVENAIQQKTIALQKSAHQYACQIVAEELRELAAQLERAAA